MNAAYRPREGRIQVAMSLAMGVLGAKMWGFGRPANLNALRNTSPPFVHTTSLFSATGYRHFSVVGGSASGHPTKHHFS